MYSPPTSSWPLVFVIIYPQAIGRFCVANPDMVSEYPNVAKLCVKRHLSAQQKASARRQQVIDLLKLYSIELLF